MEAKEFWGKALGLLLSLPFIALAIVAVFWYADFVGL